MSGVEIVGLLLGVFPLCISAMEHYEDTKRVAGTFLKIRRVHRKDLGKVKDCQLMFKLNLKELLVPLLREDIVDQGEYELLLTHPGGPAWKNKHVDMALKERLTDCHDRYVEILGEMRETMTKLCEVSKVYDEQFQQRLRTRKFSPRAQDSVQYAQDQLLIQANDYVAFQAKRTKYAFMGVRREVLLEELEAQNNKLQNVLAANDRVSALSQRRCQSLRPFVNTRLLNSWRHAENIYRILKATWQCTCRSCVNLWLQRHPTSAAHMTIVIPFCHGRKAVDFRLSDKPPTLQLYAPRTRNAGKGPTSPSTQPSNLLLGPHVNSPTVLSIRSKSTSTVTYMSQSQSQPQPPSPPTQMPASARTLCLEQDGLCKVLSVGQWGADPLGTISEGESDYAVYPAIEKISTEHGTSLADLLRPGSLLHLNRVQRYGIALTLASTHLQLHSTPWLKEYWTSEDVLFPTTQSNNVATLHGEPYVLTRFEGSSASPTNTQKDRSFSTLGIVLLELCFGYLLEEHKMWQQNPAYASLKNDPNMRQTVACEWSDEVEGEAGEDYANAVNWTLRQAPAVLKDDKWREEFAQNVVQPLQQYYEYLHPTKSS